MPNVSLEHIELDPKGVARIVGSRIKVNQIVLAKQIENLTPEQLRAQYPHLSLGEIHAALAYYYDHQAAIDAEIAREAKEADELRDKAGASPVAEKIRAMAQAM